MFYHCRELVERSYGDAEVDQFELAYAAFVVNRCSFSGIVAGTSGAIGGTRQNGTNTVASRFNPSSLEQRLRVVHELRTRLRILDAEDGVACIEELDTAGLARDVFVFCDPPYVEDAPRLYERSFETEDHRRLAQALRRLSGSWALTYDDHPLVRELYDGMRVSALPMPHRAGRAHEDVELLITPR
ncbi:DNA adenine methylase [Pseudoclavibacter soli]|uniref:DNA adenine methylase n=1 Tax=Pseudoclavibacter soli TaxID=452623 RepID=UPI0012EBBDDE|nr:DNA adenine methylase [Pseudoclavibacter soli]